MHYAKQLGRPRRTGQPTAEIDPPTLGHTASGQKQRTPRPRTGQPHRDHRKLGIAGRQPRRRLLLLPGAEPVAAHADQHRARAAQALRRKWQVPQSGADLRLDEPAAAAQAGKGGIQ